MYLLKAAELILFILSYGILLINIEAKKSAKDVSFKMAYVQACAYAFNLMMGFTFERTFKFTSTMGVVAIMWFRHRKTIDFEADKMSLHILWGSPFLAGYIAYANANGKNGMWMFFFWVMSM